VPRKNPRQYKRRLSLKEICRNAGISPREYAFLYKEMKRKLKGKWAKLEIE